MTAPTNGAEGVAPAVLLYYIATRQIDERDAVCRFLMVAGEFGSFFKKGATILAAQGGCQAEIGVSSAMAAGALDAVIGTLWETARDMSDKYKETSEGGLAAQIPVNVIEC